METDTYLHLHFCLMNCQDTPLVKSGYLIVPAKICKIHTVELILNT